MTIIDVPAELGGGTMEFGTPFSAWWRKQIRKDACAWCGKRASEQPIRTLEHIQPRSQGGADDAGNLAEACPPCNSRRGSTSLLLYLLERLDA